MKRALPLLVLAACGAPGPRHPTPAKSVARCSDLPGTFRSAPRVGRDGKSLYWIERVTRNAYNDNHDQDRLVRWDLVHAPESLGDTLGSPYRLLADGRIVSLGDDGIWLWDRGELSLISNGQTIDHLEVLDDDHLVYASGGALYVQALARDAARWLADADELIGVADHQVFARRGRDYIAIDGTSGVTRKVDTGDGRVQRVDGDALIVQRDDGIALVRGGKAELVLAGTWDLLPGPGGLQAHRKAGAGFETALIDGHGATRLPSVTGADDLEGIARFPDGMVAFLVGHDTDRDGVVGYGDEADVCLAPAGVTEVAATPRDVPLAHTGDVAAIDRVIGGRLPGATWRYVGAESLPSVEITAADELRDDDARGALVAALADELVSALHDPTLRVELRDAGGRRAVSRWDGWSHRRLRFVGVGGAVFTPLDQATIVSETQPFVRASDGSTICAGTVTNQGTDTLAGVTVSCNDGAAVAVDPATLAPGATARFSATVTVDAGAVPDVVTMVGDHHDVVFTLERSDITGQAAVAHAAADVLDYSHLVMSSWDVEDGAMVVDLTAPSGFGRYSTTARASAAAYAHTLLAKLGVVALGAPEDTPLTLRISADGETWTSDGGPPVRQP